VAIPSIIEQSENKVVVNMALRINRRNWIRKLCDHIEARYPDTG
jgi:hypothetical protein